MMKIIKTTLTFIIVVLGTVLTYGQDQPIDRVSLTFSDPSRAGFLKAGLVNGSITVNGYDGEEIIVEAKTRTRRYSKNSPRDREGLKRIAITSTGLSVEEEHNRMTVSASSHLRTIDLNIKVPKKTSLKLSTVNSGSIQIENMEGEIELNNVNGSIRAYNISGSIVANTTNGKVEVSFDKIETDKPMSFVSFNGRVDVTFPKNVKANVKMKSEQGEVYSDFEIKLEDTPRLVKEDKRRRGGKIKVKVESAMYGTINGGGPEYHFSTYNGSIYIRKAR